MCLDMHKQSSSATSKHTQNMAIIILSVYVSLYFLVASPGDREVAIELPGWLT